MQLASHGAAGLQTARQALYRSVNQNPARNIHIPAPRNTRYATGKRLFLQSRHFLSKFIGHLTAPGLGAQGSGAYHHAARTTIQSRLSLPVRTALGKQAQAFLPRPPVIPRSVTQVGLGTARNFSSARPIFQNLAQNVPVAGRAVCEMDLDVKSSKKAALKKSARGRKAGKQAPTYKVKDIKTRPVEKSQNEEVAELEHYFPTAPSENVTACLHIPLAPTPTSRTPLPETNTVDHGGSLLPLYALGSIHANHEMHSMRVSSLFSRLDAANVWDQGVQCSAYSHGAAGQGVCTILKVEFVGWTAAKVRSVIGESGTGWCTLEEVVHEFPVSSTNGYDSDCSDTSSVLSGLTGEDSGGCISRTATPPMLDPAASVVLPTLDFSSSFVNAVQSAPSTPLVLSRSSSDLSIGLSDLDYFSDSSDGFVVEPPSMTGRMNFSADFMRRSESMQEVEPMEGMF